MQEKQGFLDDDYEKKLIESLTDVLSGGDHLKLDHNFTPEEMNLPGALPVRQEIRKVDDSRRFRRKGNIEGDNFYNAFPYKRVNGKIKIRGSFFKPSGAVKQVEQTRIKWDGEAQRYVKETYVIDVIVRRQSKPAKKKAA